MKITRTINGIKYDIKLLPEELITAYYEQQSKYDIEDVISYAEMMSEEELKENYGCTYSEYLSLKEEIAAEMRHNIEAYDMDFQYAREEAVREIVQRNLAAV